MIKVVINQEKCKGCRMCISVCPKQIIYINSESLNNKGFQTAVVTDFEKCTGCTFCATICPDCAISIEKI